MTAVFKGCAPLELGGGPISVSVPSGKAVTWHQAALANPCAYGHLKTDGKGTLLADTNATGKTNLSTDGGLTWSAGSLETYDANVPGWEDTFVMADGLCFGAEAGWVYCTSGMYATCTDPTASFHTWYNMTPADWPSGVGRMISNGRRVCMFNGSSTGGAYTDNNQNWTVFPSFAGGSFEVLAPIWDGTYFSGIGLLPSGAPGLIYSTDGAHWSAYGFSPSNGVYRTVGSNGSIAAISTTPPSKTGPYLMIGGTVLEAAAATAQALPAYANADTYVQAIAVDAEDRIIAVGNYGSVMCSIDGGKTWVEDSVPWGHTAVTPTLFSEEVAVNGVNVVLVSASGSVAGLRQGLC
jgi:hypothetical protein